MDITGFLFALDDMIRGRETGCSPMLYVIAVDNLLRYISGEQADFGLEDFIQEDDFIYGEELGFCWCGADKGPYGFTIKAFQSAVLDCQEMANVLWQALYRIDQDGNEVMGEEEGIEYAKKVCAHYKTVMPDIQYQELDERFPREEIANCYYERHEDIFACAHNKVENLILLELIINSGMDEDNECGSLYKHILSFESPALDAWSDFIVSGRGRVSGKDVKKYQGILSRLENEEITYEMPNEGVELNSFRDQTKYAGGWYRTIIHDEYCFYNSYGIATSCFFAYGLISLRYLAVMLIMCDFLQEMDKKYHYLIHKDEGGRADETIRVFD
mgnify:CR=1 FL=1